MTTAEKGTGPTGHQVFISYCSQESESSTSDKRTAEMICSALESRKIRCWIAPRDILPGEEWLNSIFDAVDVSKIIVVVFSAHTEESEWVKDEIKYALDKKIKVIPFRIENVEPQGALRILKVRCQWLDAFIPPLEKHLNRLVEVVGRHLGLEPGKPIEPGEKPKPYLVKKARIEKNIKPGAQPGKVVDRHRDLESGITSKRVEKQPEVDKESTRKKIPPRLKRVLIAASIIISVIAVIFFISLLVLNREPPPEPDFIRILKSKGVEVKKIWSNSWEAVYKDDGITMIYIPPSKYWLGVAYGDDNEKPLHAVDLEGYWIGKYEVTFSQYDKYCELTGKKKPSDEGWGREKRPVINVSWNDAAAYCRWLSGKAGLKFKLPTEAQWEKAARGNNRFIYPWGYTSPSGKKVNFADKQLWLREKITSTDKNIDDGYAYTAPVGSYPLGASPYGLLDMAGNVWEWCDDWYDDSYYKYKISPPKNPLGPVSGSYRVVRGGSWITNRWGLRCAGRIKYVPSDRNRDLGFRLCQDIKDIK